MGDKVLKNIARLIEQNVREEDFVARYGGDEFVILFPDTTVAEANKICQRILDSIQQAGLGELGITGSIGLVALTESNYHDFIEKADMKMYKAKNTGKARIVS
jgi:two-component system cell cycle response regulator